MGQADWPSPWCGQIEDGDARMTQQPERSSDWVSAGGEYEERFKRAACREYSSASDVILQEQGTSLR